MNAEATMKGVRTWMRKQAVGVLFLAAVMVISSGSLDWAAGWALVGLYAATVAAQAVILIPRSPELLADRTGVQKGSDRLDTALASLAGSILPLAMWVVAGLDRRFGWTEGLSLEAQIAGIAGFALGWSLTLWAMASNAFFSLTLRIQEERDHTAQTGGPYRYIRHPGYVGAIIFQLSQPAVLGSLCGFVPMGLAVVAYVVRTALEDRALQRSLPGYKEYAGRVRWRLIPGLW